MGVYSHVFSFDAEAQRRREIVFLKILCVSASR
jgi:hypothetical protein